MIIYHLRGWWRELSFYEMGNYERKTRLVESEEKIKSCFFYMFEMSVRYLSRDIKWEV